jgi:hypothetical protein
MGYGLTSSTVLKKGSILMNWDGQFLHLTKDTEFKFGVSRGQTVYRSPRTNNVYFLVQDWDDPNKYLKHVGQEPIKFRENWREIVRSQT